MAKLITRRYKVKLAQLPAAFKGCRLLFLSDLHNCKPKNMQEQIALEKPDYILIGGDMLLGLSDEKKLRKTGMEQLEHFLCEIVRQYPVYYAYGNHEMKLSDEVREAFRRRMEQKGVIFLSDGHVALKRGEDEIFLYGLTLGKESYPRGLKKYYPVSDMTEKMGDSKKTTILLAHYPNYFPSYAKWGADLVLSGHIHGGVARIPLLGGVIAPDFLPFPFYSGGAYGIKDFKKKPSRQIRECWQKNHVVTLSDMTSAMIVSCGLGTHTIKFRFLNPPELTSIELI